MTKIFNYGKSFLLWYAHDFINFRLQELQAITRMFSIDFEWIEEPSCKDPYFLINVSSPSDIHKIMSRTVLIKSAYELWAKSKTIPELHTHLGNIPKNFLEPYIREDVSFRIMIESFGKKMPLEYKVDRIDELAFLGFEGPIKLNNPDHSFLLMEYYGTDRNYAPELPFDVFFGRWIADGQRYVSQKINLKTRKFIGNTTMDPLLSLVMANMAEIKSGDIVLDPFVGTGGLLVAAAHFGGYVLGTDIDYLMLHGKDKSSRLNQKRRAPDECVLTNMKQYGYESHYIDVIVSDAALPLWRCHSFFDAIITDPPYGIRESTERIGSEKDYKIPEHLALDHIPSKVTYSLQQIIEDLLDFNSIYLKLHGRLVFWMPCFNDDFDKKQLPQHPCLKLLSYCKQALSGHSSRYLITMEKIKENLDASEKGYVPEAILHFRKKYFQQRKKELSQINFFINKKFPHLIFFKFEARCFYKNIII
ncbi:UNVERIFIED_CONTAM: tRNA (guanine(10)-N2)-methyltransferase-like protein [Trichonephila clavipes]